LLKAAGYCFTVAPTYVPEPETAGFGSAAAYAVHVAWLKAHDAADPASWVLAADTVVALDDAILGKPADRADARRILCRLRGTCHAVVTGVCLRLPRRQVSLTTVATTTVTMKPLADDEVEGYLDSGLWEGKAGAYGIQDHDDPFVAAVDGSYTNVVGLPMERLADLFEAAMRIEDGGSIGNVRQQTWDPRYEI
jgi:septum formation protein